VNQKNGQKVKNTKVSPVVVGKGKANDKTIQN